MTMLPQNTAYDEQTSATQAFAGAAGRGVQTALSALPSPKRVDTTKLADIARRVASAQSASKLNAMASSAAQQGTRQFIPNQRGLVSYVQEGQPIDTRKIGPTTTPYGGRTAYEKFHPGLDIAAPIGTQQPAFRGGKVTEVVTGKKQTPNTPSYGNYVIITDHEGNKWRYSHLNRTWLRVGQEIQPGEILGEIGNTGSTYSTSGGTGAHLDVRIQDAYGAWVNPAKFGIRS